MAIPGINPLVINATNPLVETYLKTVSDLVNIAGVLVGGVFGFYIISFIWLIYSYSKNRALLSGLKSELARMRSSMDNLRDEIEELKKIHGSIKTKKGKR